MTARKFAARLAAAIVALVAGAASYQHIAAVAQAAGEPEWVAYTLPLAIDGLIVVGVAALLEDKAANLRPRRSAWLAVIVGVAATLAANVASAEPTVTARLVAAAAPVAFLISVEVLTGRGRPVSSSDATLSPTPTEQGAAGEAEVGVVSKPVTSRNALKSTQAAQNQSTHTRTPRRRGATAQRVAKAVADSPHATTAELAAQLGVSARTVQRYKREMAATANGYGGPVVMSPRTDS